MRAMSRLEAEAKPAPSSGREAKPATGGEGTESAPGGASAKSAPGGGTDPEPATPGAGGAAASAAGVTGGAGTTAAAGSSGAVTAAAAAPGAPFWVEVDIAQQRVRVWKEGDLLREMVASTGLPESPTPTGVFKLENRGRFFFSKKYGQGGYWWVSFLNRGEYLFHSVPTDEKGRIIPEEAKKLGQPASHGCVRLSLEDAKWFYDHMPEGTPVVIR